MKKTILSLTALASLSMATTTFANLGESKDDAISRWGKPVKVEGQKYTYWWENWMIVEFYNEADRAIVSSFTVNQPMLLNIVRSLDNHNLPDGFSNGLVELKSPSRTTRYWITGDKQFIIAAGSDNTGINWRMYADHQGMEALDQVSSQPAQKTSM
jgi:hypothetical protein